MAELEIVTMEEVQGAPCAFKERLTGASLPFSNGDKSEFTVDVEPLPHIVFKLIEEENTTAARHDYTLAFGIRNITGLKDSKGEPVKFATEKFSIGRTKYDVAAAALCNGLHGIVQEQIADKVWELTTLWLLEAQRLGFTLQSSGSAETAAQTETAPATSADSTGPEGPQAA
jgi:hypothetical protein